MDRFGTRERQTDELQSFHQSSVSQIVMRFTVALAIAWISFTAVANGAVLDTTSHKAPHPSMFESAELKRFASHSTSAETPAIESINQIHAGACSSNDENRAEDDGHGDYTLRRQSEPGDDPSPGGPPGMRPEMRFGEVDHTLRDSFAHAELPSDVSAQIERVFMKHVDFDAPARPGDHYRVEYEQNDVPPLSGDRHHVIAIELRLQGSEMSAAWFTPAQQSSGAYFSFDGGPLESAPFVMPVDGARVSSPFGARIHPGTGERREHTGVDLAAPIGTPVKAAAPGAVATTGFDKGGYGRYVVLQHAAGYSTWYAHLSAIAAHVRVGIQMRLGQRLGAVGRTGDATGAHLHFEVRHNQEPTDPLLLTRSGITPTLTGGDLIAFQTQIATVRQLFKLPLPQNRQPTSATGDRDPMRLHMC
jgi:murein DD-endopeptidase MepM/ murein hydrolase activator NlpD